MSGWRKFAIVQMAFGALMMASPFWLIATHFTIGQGGLLTAIQLFGGASMFAALTSYIVSLELEDRASVPSPPAATKTTNAATT